MRTAASKSLMRADDQVFRDQGKFEVGKFYVNNVQVWPAYRTGVDTYQDLPHVWLWARHIGET
jgi:hypothetical protein